MFGQSSLQNVISVIFGTLTRPAVHGSLEFEPYAVHHLGGETEFLAIQRALLEKLSEKNVAVALGIAIAGDEAGYVARVFDRDLNEFPFAAKAVHAGILLIVGRDGRVSATLRERGRGREHDEKNDAAKVHLHHYSTETVVAESGIGPKRELAAYRGIWSPAELGNTDIIEALL
jgi:hypothetical protein